MLSMKKLIVILMCIATKISYAQEMEAAGPIFDDRVVKILQIEHEANYSYFKKAILGSYGISASFYDYYENNENSLFARILGLTGNFDRAALELKQTRDALDEEFYEKIKKEAMIRCYH